MSGPFKGTRINLGNGRTDVVDNVQYETIRGILYITNKRIIFVGGFSGFDKRISDLIALTPYANCVEFQFSKENLDVEWKRRGCRAHQNRKLYGRGDHGGDGSVVQRYCRYFIDFLAVKSDYQKKGIGRALIDKIIEVAKEKGIAGPRLGVR